MQRVAHDPPAAARLRRAVLSIAMVVIVAGAVAGANAEMRDPRGYRGP